VIQKLQVKAVVIVVVVVVLVSEATACTLLAVTTYLDLYIAMCGLLIPVFHQVIDNHLLQSISCRPLMESVSTAELLLVNFTLAGGAESVVRHRNDMLN